jgi:hypothetical protein
MTALTRKLFTDIVRSNGIAAGPAETITAAQGWTLTNVTTSPGATPGPFGFGLSTIETSTATGSHTITIPSSFYPTGWSWTSVFVKAGTLTSLRVDDFDLTHAQSHSCDFAFTGGVWVPGTILGGATPFVSPPGAYPDGWVRLGAGFQIGAPGTGLTVFNNARQLRFRMLGDSQNVELWGAGVMGGNIPTPFPNAPPVYMLGMLDGAQNLPTVYPQRVKDSAGIVQAATSFVPSTTVILLQGRSSDDAPWLTVATISLDAADTVASLVSIWPQMRPYITTLDPSPSITSSLWLTE